MDRQFLQQGQAGKKKTRGRLARFKKKFFWVSEDLLRLYWCHGTTKDLADAEENFTYIQIANVEKIRPAPKLKKTFRLFLIDDPDVEIFFDALSPALRDRWIQTLTQLCMGDLEYRLHGDHRDQGTKISIHFRAEDQWYPGTIVGFDENTKQHMVQYDKDGKKRLNDLEKIYFRIERLPEFRRDQKTYGDVVLGAVEPTKPTPTSKAAPEATMVTEGETKTFAANVSGNESFNVEGSGDDTSSSDEDGMPPPDDNKSFLSKTTAVSLAPPDDPPPPTGVKALIGLRATGQSTSSSTSSAVTTTQGMQGESFNVEGDTSDDDDNNDDDDDDDDSSTDTADLPPPTSAFVCQEDAFQLLWDERDIGTKISVQSNKKEDNFERFYGQIVQWDGETHLVSFDHDAKDGKIRKYDMRNINFRLEELPSNRVAPNGKDIGVTPKEDHPNSLVDKHCCFTFLTQEDLDSHIKEHTPHVCEECGSRHVYGHHLHEHRKSIHVVPTGNTQPMRRAQSVLEIQQEHKRQMKEQKALQRQNGSDLLRSMKASQQEELASLSQQLAAKSAEVEHEHEVEQQLEAQLESTRQQQIARITKLEQDYQGKLKEERDNHQRELQRKHENSEQLNTEMIQALEQNYIAQLAVANEQLQRLQDNNTKLLEEHHLCPEKSRLLVLNMKEQYQQDMKKKKQYQDENIDAVSTKLAEEKIKSAALQESVTALEEQLQSVHADNRTELEQQRSKFANANLLHQEEYATLQHQHAENLASQTEQHANEIHQHHEQHRVLTTKHSQAIESHVVLHEKRKIDTARKEKEHQQELEQIKTQHLKMNEDKENQLVQINSTLAVLTAERDTALQEKNQTTTILAGTVRELAKEKDDHAKTREALITSENTHKIAMNQMQRTFEHEAEQTHLTIQRFQSRANVAENTINQLQLAQHHKKQKKKK